VIFHMLSSCLYALFLTYRRNLSSLVVFLSFKRRNNNNAEYTGMSVTDCIRFSRFHWYVKQDKISDQSRPTVASEIIIQHKMCGMAKLNRPRWLVKYQDGIPANGHS